MSDGVRRPQAFSHSPLRAELAVFLGLMVGLFGCWPACRALYPEGDLSASGALAVACIVPSVGLLGGLLYAYLVEMPTSRRGAFRRSVLLWAGIGSVLCGLLFSPVLGLPVNNEWLSPAGAWLAITIFGLFAGTLCGIAWGFAVIRVQLAREKRDFEDRVGADNEGARDAPGGNPYKVGPPGEAIRGSDHQQVAEGPSIDEQR